MPLTKACDHYASRVATYNEDDIPRDKAMATMTCNIDKLATQMTKLLTKHHRIIEDKDISSENFTNPFFGHQHKTESIDNKRWEFELRINILDFQGSD